MALNAVVVTSLLDRWMRAAALRESVDEWVPFLIHEHDCFQWPCQGTSMFGTMPTPVNIASLGRQTQFGARVDVVLVRFAARGILLRNRGVDP